VFYDEVLGHQKNKKKKEKKRGINQGNGIVQGEGTRDEIEFVYSNYSLSSLICCPKIQLRFSFFVIAKYFFKSQNESYFFVVKNFGLFGGNIIDKLVLRIYLCIHTKTPLRPLRPWTKQNVCIMDNFVYIILSILKKLVTLPAWAVLSQDIP